MNSLINTSLHFTVMIIASFILFLFIIRIVLSKQEFALKRKRILFLSFVVIVIGMLFGKYGANFGLPWWIYYTVPMLMTVLLPPVILKLNKKQTVYYLILSFLSAPFIHVLFSFFFGWKEYLPFWDIPYIGSL